MPRTTVPDSHTDLLTAPVASLTTLDKHGAPQATLVWFVYDESDQTFKISLADQQLKTKHLLARPQVSLLILDPDSPMRYMDVRGEAQLEEDVDFAWAIANVNPKYDADVRDFPGSLRYVVSIAVSNIYALDMRRH